MTTDNFDFRRVLLGQTFDQVWVTCYNNAMKKYILSLCFLLILFFTSAVAAEEPDIAAQNVIAVETSTGKVLYDKNADSKNYIASISKILTIYLVLENIHEGKLSWDTEVSLSDYAYGLVEDSTISNPGMTNRVYTVRELVNASMVVSANSAAIALAEKIAGSEPAFVDLMRAKLEEWGITDYQIVNSSGLNNSALNGNVYPNSGENDENMLSAKSVAIIAYHLIQDFPEILDISSQSSVELGDESYATSNKMLAGQILERQGVDGLKTGTTELAGQALVITSKENGMRIIAVILHADNADSDDYARFTEANKLLDYLYQTFELTDLYSSGQHLHSLTISNVSSKKVTPYVKDSLTVVRRKGSDVSETITLDLANNKLTSPISKNQKIGRLIFNDPDVIGDGYLFKEPSISLYSSEKITQSWQSHLKAFFQDLLKKFF